MSGTLFGDEKTDKIDALVAELHKTPGWPADPQRDAAFLTELAAQFPSLDLTEELGRYRVWLLQQDPGEAKRRVTSRGRLQTLRNWCSNVRTGPTPGRTSTGRSRTSTAARPADAFGRESSTTLSRW